MEKMTMNSSLNQQQEINTWEDLYNALISYESDIQWYPMKDKNGYRKYTRFIKSNKKESI